MLRVVLLDRSCHVDVIAILPVIGHSVASGWSEWVRNLAGLVCSHSYGKGIVSCFEILDRSCVRRDS